MSIVRTLSSMAALPALLLLVSTAVADQRSDQMETFGDIVVRYSAISTDQLFPEVAKSYGIARSSHNGLVNIAVQKKDADGTPQLIAAAVSGSVGDLSGHHKPIAFRETKENGDIDYLGEFPLDTSDTYVFDIKVIVPGHAQPFALKFNRAYVVD